MAKDCIEVIVTPEFASKDKSGRLVFRGKPPALNVRQETHHGKSYIIKSPQYNYDPELAAVNLAVQEALSLTDSYQGYVIRYRSFPDGKKKVDISPAKITR